MLLILQSDSVAQLPAEAGLSLSEAADMASVIVAALAFGFSMYTLWVQRKWDRQNLKEAAESQAQAKVEAERQRMQAIRLQWYKDLVISPNIEGLTTFYEALHEIRNSISAPDLDSESKTELIEKIKAAQRLIRKTLVDSILPISINLHDAVLANLDQLVDIITNALDNDRLKLSNPEVNDTEIGQPVRDSKKDILTIIYGYRGESE